MTIKQVNYFIIIRFLLIYSLGYSQKIGIGTSNPKAALEIVSTTQGLLVPRATGSQILSMVTGADQNSMLVYATSTSGAINKIGFWYYDNASTSWRPFVPNYSSTNGISLSGNTLKLGGTLTEATSISSLTATNKMSFTGTGTDIFNIDGNTMSIDATNDRVGIGTAAPSTRLHVTSTTNADGGSENMTLSLPNISSSHLSSIRLIDNITGVGNGDLFRTAIVNNNTEQFTISSGGNMGIGANAPTSKFQISASNIATGFRLVDGTQANNRVLGCDANGNAIWKELSLNRIIGVKSSGVNLSLVPNATYYQTGCYIDLPTGKWEVKVNMVLSYTGGTLTSNDWAWVRTSFSDSNGANPAFTPDFIGGFRVSGLYQGPASTPIKNAMLNGRVVINNTSGATKRYYYIAGEIATSSMGTLNGYFSAFGDNTTGENMITAVSIQ